MLRRKRSLNIKQRIHKCEKIWLIINFFLKDSKMVSFSPPTLVWKVIRLFTSPHPPTEARRERRGGIITLGIQTQSLSPCRPLGGRWERVGAARRRMSFRTIPTPNNGFKHGNWQVNLYVASKACVRWSVKQTFSLVPDLRSYESFEGTFYTSGPWRGAECTFWTVRNRIDSYSSLRDLPCQTFLYKTFLATSLSTT